MAPCAASKREAAKPTRFGSLCAWLEAARTITWKPTPPDRRPTQFGGENEMARQRTTKGPSSPAWVRKHPRGAPAVALLACFIGLTGASAARSESAMLDLSRAVVVTPPARTGPERKAVELLVEDVARRSGIRWKVLSHWPAEPVLVVGIGSSSAAKAFTGPFAEF